MAVHPVIETFLGAVEAERGADGSVWGSPTQSAGLLAYLGPRAVEPLAPTVRWRDVTFESFDGAQVRMRMVTSDAVPADGAGAYVYFHGGGWWTGDLDTPLSRMGHWSALAGVQVFAVDYRLAPSHLFPVGLRDCLAAVQWVAAGAQELGVDPGRIAIGGDSAGGNLSCAVAAMARDGGGPAIAYQLLEEPSLDLRPVEPGQRPMDHGWGLEWHELTFAARQYVGPTGDPANPLVSPLLQQDFSGLPPTHVLTAYHDPLREDGIGYALALARAGVRAGFTCYPDLIHGSHLATGMIDSARAWQAEGAAVLRAAVGNQ